MSTESTQAKTRRSRINLDDKACELIDYASNDMNGDPDFQMAWDFCELFHKNLEGGLTPEENERVQTANQHFIKRAKKWQRPFRPGETLIRNKPNPN